MLLQYRAYFPIRRAEGPPLADGSRSSFFTSAGFPCHYGAFLRTNARGSQAWAERVFSPLRSSLPPYSSVATCQTNALFPLQGELFPDGEKLCLSPELQAPGRARERESG